MLNIAVFAPMPSARVRMPTSGESPAAPEQPHAVAKLLEHRH